VVGHVRGMSTRQEEDRFVKVEAHVVEAISKSPADFWRGFEEISGDLDRDAFADDADDELLERYTSLLANADEAGFVVPLEAMGALDEDDQPHPGFTASVA